MSTVPLPGCGATEGVAGEVGKVIVLDGGLSTALEARGHDLTDALWTARVLRDDPQAVAQAHRDFFAAGARVATTASYQASVPSFVAAGMTRDEARRVLLRSVAVAREVRDELAGDGTARWVAASVGPYGAVLADGSEYTGYAGRSGRDGVSRVQLREFHQPRLEMLASAGPDLLAVETIPDLVEAEVLVELLADIGLPAWLSYSARGGQTAAKQPLAEAFSVAAAPDNVVAVGVNCCPAPDVLEAVRLAVQTTGKAAVAYPNGAEWDAAGRRWLPGSRFEVAQAAEWVGAGAVLVGGCCGVGPAAIADLASLPHPIRP